VNLEVRRPIIAGNWKMHKTVVEARKLALDVKNATVNLVSEIDIVLCPPFGAATRLASRHRFRGDAQGRGCL
jgi:triosephosphate isomerase